MTRRMMATVSELSMYQAHSIKLSADKEALEGEVVAASDKLEVEPLLDCILYLTLKQYPCDPGILPGSAGQCILGKVYLRSNLASKLEVGLFIVWLVCQGKYTHIHDV